MRLTAIALASLLGSANAFVPGPVAQQRSSQHVLNLSNNQQQNADIFEGARTAVLGTVTAATIFMGTMVPIPDVDVANAATKAAAPAVEETTAVAKKATKTKKVEAAPATPAPLSAEKSALASAKAAYSASQTPLKEAKSAVSTATSTYNKAKATRESTQKQATQLKKNLVDVNDKLAKAKRNKKNAQVTDLYVKEIDTIKTKLSAAEKSLVTAKADETNSAKDLSTKEKMLVTADKNAKSAQTSVANAEKKLEGATKKLKEEQLKAEKKAKEAKKQAEKKAKEEKKKAEKMWVLSDGWTRLCAVGAYDIVHHGSCLPHMLVWWGLFEYWYQHLCLTTCFELTLFIPLLCI